jgi:16S rRNA processing protein RimM
VPERHTANGKQQAAKVPSRTSFAKRVKRARAKAAPRTPAAGLKPLRSARTSASSLGPPASTPSPAETPAGESTPRPTSLAAPKPQAEPDEGFVAVGRVGAPFGLKGELKVQVLTDNMARFKPGARIWAGSQPVTVAASREAQGYVYLRLKGFNDRSSTEKLRHALLQVPESDLPPLPDGQFYRFQLIGLAVVDRAGDVLGTLDEVIETGANDVYRVHPESGPDLLLPALDDVIVIVDLAARRMVVDPPEWR